MDYRIQVTFIILNNITNNVFMKKNLSPALCIILLAGITFRLNAQVPLSQRTWKSVATGMPDEWYGSKESKAVAENVLLYQRNIGGWPKNIPMHRLLSDAERVEIQRDKNKTDAILDNSATTTKMKFLARMYNNTKTGIYRSAFLKSLNFILEAQYDNGGWPMFYPLKKGYYTHITYNDNAIVNILEMLDDIYNKKPLYTFVATEEVALKAKIAFEKGIDCILKTQIVVKGKPTVWCAQHDENTFLPAKARSYELPSFSGAESAGIINLLMKVPVPSRKIILSVQSAIEWLEKHKIKHTRWKSFINKDGLKDRMIVSDPKAGDMWARFYDLETELPFICDRDGIKKSSLEEIGYERRNGYSWYTTEPQKVIDKYPVWKDKWVK